MGFDSYKRERESSDDPYFRLLDVDHSVVLPVYSVIQALVTADDVVHRWAVPALGIKADGIPGRLNSLNFYFRHSCVLYGQCSEICGANHSFMPICVEASSMSRFRLWTNCMKLPIFLG